MMNHRARSIFFIIILILLILFLPAFMGGNIIDDVPGEDDLSEGDDLTVFSNAVIIWAQMPVHQLTVFLRAGISFFVLFVVYLGGRSKHRRFNDRTIDPAGFLIVRALKTALFRAVFNFFFVPPPNVLSPIPIANKRSKRL